MCSSCDTARGRRKPLPPNQPLFTSAAGAKQNINKMRDDIGLVLAPFAVRRYAARRVDSYFFLVIPWLLKSAHEISPIPCVCVSLRQM